MHYFGDASARPLPDATPTLFKYFGDSFPGTRRKDLTSGKTETEIKTKTTTKAKTKTKTKIATWEIPESEGS